MDEPKLFEAVGEKLIAGALLVVAWVMKTFTGRHLEAMDKLTEKLEGMSGDVREMKTDIRVLKEHHAITDRRLERLEDDDV